MVVLILNKFEACRSGKHVKNLFSHEKFPEKTPYTSESLN